jgi:hypothetical protein
MSRAPLILLLTLIACGEPGLELATPVLDTSTTGVIHVANSGPTAWADTSGWRLVLERTIAPMAGAPGELSDPRSLVVDSHGRIFVLDARPTIVKIFDRDGSLVGSFAPEGSGPGEISDRGLLMVARDTLVIQDIRQTRATTFTRDGEMITEWPSLCCMGMNSWADTEGRFPVPGMVYPMQDPSDPLSAVGFVRYTADGTSGDTITYPASGIPSATWDGLGKPIPIPLQPADRYLFTTGGRVVSGHQSAYRLAISTNGRDTVRTFTGLSPQVPIPDEDREAAYRGMVDRVPGLDAVTHVDDLPTVYPPWDDMRSDGRGNIWVMAPGPSGNRDHWDVFTPGGVLLGAVPAPFTEVQRTFWTDDHVYAVVEDPATGFAEVKVYRIERRLH